MPYTKDGTWLEMEEYNKYLANQQLKTESTSGLGIEPPPEPPPRSPELTAWQPTNTWKGDVTDSSGNMVGGYVPVSPDAITISGVGNKMMIDDPSIPNMPPVDEYGNPVAPETVRRIQSNLGDAPISEEDRKFLGVKPPDENELALADELDKWGKYIDAQGVKDPEKRAQYMINARRDAQSRLDNLAKEKAKAVGGLSPEAIQIEGIKFAQTGKMPALGMAGGSARMLIINAAANHLKEQGIDPATVPAINAEFGATKKAFESIKRSTEQLAGFEGGLIKNAKVAEDLSAKYYRNTNIPAVDKVMNAIRTKTGDASTLEFANAIYAASIEYEKLRTAGTGVSSAELSVGAQKKAEELINMSHTHEQLQKALGIMRIDAKNITAARNQTLVDMGKEMRNLTGTFNSTKEKADQSPSNGIDMSQVVEKRIGKNGKALFRLKDGRIISE